MCSITFLLKRLYLEKLASFSLISKKNSVKPSKPCKQCRPFRVTAFKYCRAIFFIFKTATHHKNLEKMQSNCANKKWG